MAHATFTGMLDPALTNLERALDCALRPTPESLDRSAALLADVSRSLRACVSQPSSAGAASQAAALSELQKRLARFRLLLDHAAEFYRGWSRLRDSLTAGYAASGEPVSAALPGRLNVEG